MGRALTLLFPSSIYGNGDVIVHNQITMSYCDQSFLDIFDKVEKKTGIDGPRKGISVHNIRGTNRIKESINSDYGRIKSVLIKDLKQALKKYPKRKLDHWHQFKPIVAFINKHRGDWPVYLYWS